MININSYNTNNQNNLEKDRISHIVSANEKVRNNRQLSQNPTQLILLNNNNMNNLQLQPSSKEINIFNRKVNSSKKPKTKDKMINFKNKNDLKEEFTNKKKKKYETSSTEKSNISSLSQQDNVPNTNNNNISNNYNLNLFHLDEEGELDNSHSKEKLGIRNQNRQNIFKEKEVKEVKKKHGCIESPHYNPSPIKREFPKLYNQVSNNGNNSNVMKKKELNNFLNDRPRQNKSKKPFKI